VWQCAGPQADECCDDGDNCTVDACVASVCKNTLLRECDCRYVNNCVDCVRMEKVRCAYDLAGACFSFNQTLYKENPQAYGLRTPIYDNKGIADFCLSKSGKGGKTGVIVGAVLGSIAGAAALAALLALVAYRYKHGGIFGPSAGQAGAGAAAGTVQNPAYVAANTQGTSALYSA